MSEVTGYGQEVNYPQLLLCEESNDHSFEIRQFFESAYRDAKLHIHIIVKCKKRELRHSRNITEAAITVK